jgi:hypothetical protein
MNSDFKPLKKIGGNKKPGPTNDRERTPVLQPRDIGKKAHNSIL